MISNQPKPWGIGWGFVTGATLTLIALVTLPEQAPSQIGISHWLATNLGHSIWPFAAVALCFFLKLRRLHALLAQPDLPLSESSNIVALEQMLDVWTQVFIGIGVVWTAIGMRSALQYALGEPQAVLSDDAGNVLRKLVDGGILLALSTTIVGAVGGYLMRLVKTIYLGPQLQRFHEQLERQDLSALLQAAERIESHLDHLGLQPSNITPLQPHPASKS